MTVKLKISAPRKGLYLGVPLILFLFCYLITFTVAYKKNEQLLSYGIICDLLITTPLVYLLLIRKSRISHATVLRVFIAGVVVSGFILKSNSVPALEFIKLWIVPVVEAATILFVINRFYRANRAAKKDRQERADLLSHCRQVFGTVMGNQRIGDAIATEIVMIYYAFFCKKYKDVDDQRTFTSYKGNALMPVLYLILSVLLTETVIMHLVFSLWDRTLAWILTGLSLYTCMQFLAHIRAIKARVIKIGENRLTLHMGLAADAFIDLKNVESAELLAKDHKEQNAVKIALLNKMEKQNIKLQLKEPIEIIKFFGIRKRSSTVLFYVDKPQNFLDSLNSVAETLTTRLSS